MEYLIAAYTVIILGLIGYIAWLLRQKLLLRRELAVLEVQRKSERTPPPVPF